MKKKSVKSNENAETPESAAQIEGGSPNQPDKSKWREIPVDLNHRQPPANKQMLTPTEKEKQLPKYYPPGTVGVIKEVKNKVELCDEGKHTRIICHDAKEGEAVNKDQIIRTGRGGFTQIDNLDGTKTRLGGRTTRYPGGQLPAEFKKPNTPVGTLGSLPDSDNKIASAAIENVRHESNILDYVEEMLENGLSLRAMNGVVYRFSDGDWMARVTFRLLNEGAQPLFIAREKAFEVEDYTQSISSGSLPEEINLLPGVEVQGDVQWYRGADTPLPYSLPLRYLSGGRLLWSGDVPLIHTPAQPEPETAPSSVVWVLPLEIEEPVQAWKYDGSPAASVKFSLANPLDVALYVPTAFFKAQMMDAKGDAGSVSSALTSFENELRLEANETYHGHITWYWSEDIKQLPDSILLTFGAPGQPMLRKNFDCTLVEAMPDGFSKED